MPSVLKFLILFTIVSWCLACDEQYCPVVCLNSLSDPCTYWTCMCNCDSTCNYCPIKVGYCQSPGPSPGRSPSPSPDAPSFKKDLRGDLFEYQSLDADRTNAKLAYLLISSIGLNLIPLLICLIGDKKPQHKEALKIKNWKVKLIIPFHMIIQMMLMYVLTFGVHDFVEIRTNNYYQFVVDYKNETWKRTSYGEIANYTIKCNSPFKSFCLDSGLKEGTKMTIEKAGNATLTLSLIVFIIYPFGIILAITNLNKNNNPNLHKLVSTLKASFDIFFMIAQSPFHHVVMILNLLFPISLAPYFYDYTQGITNQQQESVSSLVKDNGKANEMKEVKRSRQEEINNLRLSVSRLNI